MKKIIILTLIICSIFSTYCQERINRQQLNYLNETESITNSIGWEYNEKIGKWISNKNFISKHESNSLITASKVEQNFNSLSTKTLEYNNNVYYIIYIESWGGRYKYPTLKKDWTTFKRHEAYIFNNNEFKKLTDLDKDKSVILKTKIFTSEREHWLESDFINYIQKAIIDGETSVDIVFHVKRLENGDIRFLLPASESDFTGRYSGIIYYDFSKMYFETTYENFSKLTSFN